jgi:4'-phosphopantetheinyl transferase
LRLADGGPVTDLDFNVSHSGSLSAVALTYGRRVGVDLEERRAERELRSLVPDVMGAGEREMLDALEGEEFLRAFYACWTRKEAIVKATGVGIAHGVTSIDIPDLPPGGLVHVANERGTLETWTLQTTELPDGYTLSVALAGAGGRVEVVQGDSNKRPWKNGRAG